MTPRAASWSRSFTVFRNSAAAFSFSFRERTRFTAVRIRDFHIALRICLRFDERALFTADLCCAIDDPYEA